MEELLKTYYEYFIKGNFQDKINTYNGSDFYDFYKIIINKYDISKDDQVRYDLFDFFDFFDGEAGFRRCRGSFSLSHGEENSKRRFNESKVSSFDWFKPSPYLIKNTSFVYSIKHTKDVFCKAYISIKPEYYVKTLIKLQDFINELYEKHGDEELGQIKFRKYPANDAIVMRFAKEEHYFEFLEYLRQNSEIIDSFDEPNKFMPQDEYGISIIPDNDSSYNYFVTRMLWDYMFYCRDNKAIVSISSLVDFIDNYDCSMDKMLNRNGEEINSTYKSILTGKFLLKSNEELLSYIFKTDDKVLKLKK